VEQNKTGIAAQSGENLEGSTGEGKGFKID